MCDHWVATMNPALCFCFERLRFVLIASVIASGCTLVPEKRIVEQIHNPFPQLHTIAILPFFNQSENPNVDGEATASAYYAELQAIPGFEVLPVGVTLNGLRQYIGQYGEPSGGAEFQSLAKFLGVDAVVIGSVTDFDAFYPPRLAMTTRWYAANESFHEIPPGYGLPWGTDAEKHIPRRIVEEAEFALAREQLATQTPVAPAIPNGFANAQKSIEPSVVQVVAIDHSLPPAPDDILVGDNQFAAGNNASLFEALPPAPPNKFVGGANELQFQTSVAIAPPPTARHWPDPTGFIPDPPSVVATPSLINHDAILSHTRIYRGDDAYLTNRLADYVETGDDARSSGWQGYLRRSDDFVRFCCHLHITEMLESRGGRDQSDLIVRWAMSRY